MAPGLLPCVCLEVVRGVEVRDGRPHRQVGTARDGGRSAAGDGFGRRSDIRSRCATFGRDEATDFVEQPDPGEWRCGDVDQPGEGPAGKPFRVGADLGGGDRYAGVDRGTQGVAECLRPDGGKPDQMRRDPSRSSRARSALIIASGYLHSPEGGRGEWSVGMTDQVDLGRLRVDHFRDRRDGSSAFVIDQRAEDGDPDLAVAGRQ